MKERRKYVRFDTSLRVSYKTLEEPVIEGKSLSKNICCGGINIFLEQKVRPGVPIELKITFGETIKLISVVGKVIWQKRLGPFEKAKAYYDTGIRFTKIDEADKKAIELYIRDRLKEESEKERYL